MGSTRTPGITVDTSGNRLINKEHHGVRLFLRLGPVSQENVERQLVTAIERLDLDRDRRAHSRSLFRHCAHESDEEERALLERHEERIEPHRVIAVEILGRVCSDEDAQLEIYKRAGRFGSAEAIRRLGDVNFPFGS